MSVFWIFKSASRVTSSPSANPFCACHMRPWGSVNDWLLPAFIRKTPYDGAVAGDEGGPATTKSVENIEDTLIHKKRHCMDSSNASVHLDLLISEIGIRHFIMSV